MSVFPSEDCWKTVKVWTKYGMTVVKCVSGASGCPQWQPGCWTREVLFHLTQQSSDYFDVLCLLRRREWLEGRCSFLLALL